LKGLIIRLPIDKHQIWSDVAIAAILPVARQCMIVKFLCQRLILRKSLNHGHEILGKKGPMLPFRFALQVAPEGS
jgi:hypothetical protein